MPNPVLEFGSPCLPRRFWDKVSINDATGCWIWTAGLFPRGYASYWHNGKNYSGHRAAFEAFKGPIQVGLHLDHLCRTPKCVNPDHLEAVTPKENNARGIGISANNAKKQNCPRCGSEYTQYRHGTRFCRPCRIQYLRDMRRKRLEGGKTLRGVWGDAVYENYLLRQRELYRAKKSRQTA